MTDSEIAIRIARSTFVRSKRESCCVCGKWSSITQAHHLRPVAEQARAGEVIDQSHVWLCPTHHVALHVLLAQANGKRRKASRQIVDLISEIDGLEELRKLLDLMKRAAE